MHKYKNAYELVINFCQELDSLDYLFLVCFYVTLAFDSPRSLLFKKSVCNKCV